MKMNYYHIEGLPSGLPRWLSSLTMVSYVAVFLMIVVLGFFVKLPSYTSFESYAGLSAGNQGTLNITFQHLPAGTIIPDQRISITIYPAGGPTSREISGKIVTVRQSTLTLLSDASAPIQTAAANDFLKVTLQNKSRSIFEKIRDNLTRTEH